LPIERPTIEGLRGVVINRFSSSCARPAPSASPTPSGGRVEKVSWVINRDASAKAKTATQGQRHRHQLSPIHVRSTVLSSPTLPHQASIRPKSASIKRSVAGPYPHSSRHVHAHMHASGLRIETGRTARGAECVQQKPQSRNRRSQRRAQRSKESRRAEKKRVPPHSPSSSEHRISTTASRYRVCTRCRWTCPPLSARAMPLAQPLAP
jgi:hypothetical protein